MNGSRYSLDELVQKLAQEGSLPEYYEYLASRYGSQTNGDLFGYTLEYPERIAQASKAGDHFAKGFLDTSKNNYQSSQPGKICPNFLYSAMEQDLAHKPLDLIFKVAEVEQQFNEHPYLRSIDILYKLNLFADVDTSEEIGDKVKEYETSFTEGQD